MYVETIVFIAEMTIDEVKGTKESTRLDTHPESASIQTLKTCVGHLRFPSSDL